MSEAQAKVEAELKVASGYYIEWGGSFKTSEKAKSCRGDRKFKTTPHLQFEDVAMLQLYT